MPLRSVKPVNSRSSVGLSTLATRVVSVMDETEEPRLADPSDADTRLGVLPLDPRCAATVGAGAGPRPI